MDLKIGQVRLFLILAILALALYIIEPFLITVILGAIVAYLLWPLHKRIMKYIGETPSSLILTLTTVIIVIGSIYYGINLLLEESANFYLFLSKLNIPYISPTTQEFARSITTKFISTLSEHILTIINIIAASVVFFISLFYFLKEGDIIYEKISKILPFEIKSRNRIVKNIKLHLDTFVHVQIVIGIVQGILAAIGFWIFGIPYPILAGFAAGIASILPIIGPYVIYIPVGIFAYASYGLTTALGIIIYGLSLGSIMDYLIRPFFYGKKVRMHPLVMFLGIFGGMKVMGFIGIVIGPIILSIAIALFKELKINNG
ncbi:AI-2E family transporter [Candidatus Woesearchaeota archaeon]|jgi:predicted PurR-regulated permease PerM|nr:AI-2E family transporter [Candidatus Woesearchaeota archaeon]MBT7062594.1 AI-2E family transporter [Candidatus Woesearchaeota archaeon]MBT7402753.1 AI-2E family transporter [Candidatus Woesearchaeota archaeon]